MTDTTRKLVQEAVKETLIQIGFDVSNPLDMQRDLQHLREWRVAMTQVKEKSLVTLVGIAISGMAALLYTFIKK